MEEYTLKEENDLFLNPFSDFPEDDSSYDSSSSFDLEATEKAFKALEDQLRQYSEQHNIKTNFSPSIPLPKLNQEQVEEAVVQAPVSESVRVVEPPKKPVQPSLLQHLGNNTSKDKDLEDEMALRQLMIAPKTIEPVQTMEEEEPLPKVLPKVLPQTPRVAPSVEVKEQNLTMPLNLDNVEASAKKTHYASVADTIKVVETEASISQLDLEDAPVLEARSSIRPEQAQSLSHVKPFRVTKIENPQGQSEGKKKTKSEKPLERDLLALMLEKNLKKKQEENIQEEKPQEDVTVSQFTEFAKDLPQTPQVEEQYVPVEETLTEELIPVEMSEDQKEQVKNLFDEQKRKEKEQLLDGVKRAKKAKLFALIFSVFFAVLIVSGGIYAYWTYHQGEQALKTLTVEVQSLQEEVLGADTYEKVLPILQKLEEQRFSFFQKEQIEALRVKVEAKLLERQNIVMQQLEQNAKEQSQKILEGVKDLTELNQRIFQNFEEYQQLEKYTETESGALEQWLQTMQKNTYQAYTLLEGPQINRLSRYTGKNTDLVQALAKDLEVFRSENLEKLFNDLVEAKKKADVEQVSALTATLQEKSAQFSEYTQKYLMNLHEENAHFELELLLEKAVEAQNSGKIERANRIFALLEKEDLPESFMQKESFVKLKETLSALNVSLKANTETPALNFQIKALMANVQASKASANYRAFTNHNLTSNTFQAFLKALYDADYVLANPQDAFDPLGKYWAYQLPEGKKPLVLEFQDVAVLNRVSDGAYFADQLSVNENGKLIAKTGTGEENENNLVLQLEKFIRDYPDFSFDGARANLQLQQKDSLFGQSLKEEAGQTLLQNLYNKGYRLTLLASDYGNNREQMLDGLLEAGIYYNSVVPQALSTVLMEASVYNQWTEENKELLATQSLNNYEIRDNRVLYQATQDYAFSHVMDLRPYMLYKKEYNAYFDNWTIYQTLVTDGHYVSAN